MLGYNLKVSSYWTIAKFVMLCRYTSRCDWRRVFIERNVSECGTTLSLWRSWSRQESWYVTVF